MGNPGPKTPLTLSRITFPGGILEAIRGSDGSAHLSIAAACETLGIDTTAQIERLKRTNWATGCMTKPVALASDGKQRAVTCLRADRVAMWLATLDASRIKDAEVRARIELWQQHAADALDKWVRGAEQPASVSAPTDPLLPELIAELRAGREERRLAQEVHRQTFGVLLQLTERLLQPQARPEPMPLTSVQVQAPNPTPALAQSAKAEPRADYFVTAVKLGAELGLKKSAIYRFFQAHPDLRKMQRADGRWPLYATMEEVRRRRQQPAARPAQAAKPRKARSTHQLAERAAVVFHMRTYCKANDLTQDQAAAAWHRIYDAFTNWAGYDPRKLKAPGQRPLDVVAEREHMEHFLLIVKEVCPLVDKAEGASA